MESEVAAPAQSQSKKKKTPPKAPKPPPKPRVRKPKATESGKNKAQSENAKPKLPRSRAKTKGKKKLDPSSQEVQLCPDILNELRSFEVSTTPKTSSGTNTSRSLSTNSAPTDNFSWVKEISSSSTTTPTLELVCIDGKIPEIKLVDCGKTARRQCKRRLDDVDSNSGSSKTSGSSSKRMKVNKNTFSMSQKKFRLSLRKKNNNWTVSKPNETSTAVEATDVSNNKAKISSSSSDIRYKIQLGKRKVSPQRLAVPEAAAVAEASTKKRRPKKDKKAANVNVKTIVMESEVAAPAQSQSKKKKTPPKAPKPPPKPRVRKPKATESGKNKAQSENAKPKLPRSRAKTKGKKKLDPSSQEVQLCPDILNELRSFEVSTTPKTSSGTNTSRSLSTNSAPTDNFSWVKEISSSSTTTPTLELVCIDGKIPEIKLVDCGKTARRQCKRRLDDVDSISGSSKTSGSSSKRMKVNKNTFSMSQKKFRLSLRKKNNNWTVSKPNETSTAVEATDVSNNKDKISSSSSDIRYKIQLGKRKVSPQRLAVPEAAAVAEASTKKRRPKKDKKAANVNVETIVMESEVAAPAQSQSKKKKTPPKAPKPPPKPRVRKPKATESGKNKAQSENAKPKLPRSRAKTKGKKKLDPSSQEVQLCPDILNELRSFEVSTTPKTSSGTNTSRSLSTNSAPTDNFSWVKEISSSSTTTPTLELVCIDGKIPEIKLVDCGKTARRQCKRRLDDVDSISGSSKTSGSSSKRMKVNKNTFSMSQKKFRLSLRKKNNNWTVSKPNETSTAVEATDVSNNKDKISSSSSDISHRSNIDLSSSSSSSSSHSTHITTNSLINRPNLTEAVTETVSHIDNRQKLQNIRDIRQKLDSSDLEFISWLGEVDKEVNLNKLCISSDILRLEHEAIIESRHFKLRLSNSLSKRSSEKNAPKTSSKEVTEDLPNNDQDISNNLQTENAIDSQEPNENNVDIDDIIATPIATNTEDVRRKSCGETNYINDDDDALSLFAESITGIESSRFSTVEYYKAARSPQCSPLSDDERNCPDFTEDFSYYKFSSGTDSSPNKSRELSERIFEREINKDIFTSTIPKFTEKPNMVTCVRKVANSTSVHKDENFVLPNNFPQDNLPNKNQSKSFQINVNYIATSPVKSQVFRGVCFFNLISKCKYKNQCNFPHQRIPNEEIQNRVQRLQETNFINEYMLVRKYPQLRDSYIIIFVNECFRRDLTPILLEMIIDCYKEQPSIRTHALELALLNISSKNLDDYAFLLNYYSEIIGDKVCDVLMKELANTQNFTRFKQVFVKLTDFMVDVGRTFVLDVSEKILERICILPYEESLANSMMQIIKHTSVDIFKKSSMNIFEKRLRELSMDILSKLEAYKKAVLVLEPIPPKVVITTTKAVGSVNGQGPGLEKPTETEKRRYRSPDTTNFETTQMNLPNRQLIIRTIDLSNNAKTYIGKPPPNPQSAEEAQPTARKQLNRPLPTLLQPLLRPAYLNVKNDSSVVKQPEGTKKFTLIRQRLGRDAPFW